MTHPAKILRKKQKEEIASLKQENNVLRERIGNSHSILKSTMHEVRQFSSVISDSSFRLVKTNNNAKTIEDLANTIHYTSGMLSARLGFTDIEINPEVIEGQVDLRMGMYKKFDKARYLLMQLANEKKSKIIFNGTSRLEIDAIQAFEMVPFVILHNAVKYSPPGYEIAVNFDEPNMQYLEVSVASFGPKVLESELHQLFIREFRGSNSKGTEGEGLGLHLAKRLCEIHDINIKIELGTELGISLEGISYQKFIATLTFNKY
jgi:K+-sensing histidine kinase KdpD